MFSKVKRYVYDKSISKITYFIVGCCYGIPYNGPFSVTYPDNLNIPLFPVQLLKQLLLF
ncbi:MAG: hypothetical protein MR265_03950 [Erysipelotrichaceae bacterium]|nr:hypothetical protein [Erysipelotrichaceae bacterium]